MNRTVPTTTEDIAAEPMAEMRESFPAERGREATPRMEGRPGSPLKAVDQAMKVAQQLQYDLAQVKANVDAGYYTRSRSAAATG